MSINEILKIKNIDLKIFKRKLYLLSGIFIIFGILGGIIIPLFPIEIITAFIIAVSCGLIGYFYIIKSIDYKKGASFLVKVFIGSFLLRVLIVLAIYLVSIDRGGNGILGVPDEGAFDSIGWETAQNWHSGNIQVSPVLISFGYANWGYYLFNAVVYFFVGHNPLVVGLINSFLGTMMMILIFKIVTITYPVRVGKIAAALVGFNPTLIFWSVLNLKDILFAFLLIVTLYYVLSLSQKWEVKIFIKFFILGFVLFTIRDSYAFVWLSICSIYLLRKSAFRFLAWGILFMGIGWMVSLSLPFTSMFYNILVGSPSEFLKLLPLTIIRFFFTPLPWKATGYFRLIIPGTILWYLLMPFTFYGIYYSIINKVKGSLLSIGFIISVLIILSTVFLGGSPRHQVPIIPLYMIYAAVGVVKLRRLLLLRIYVPITVSMILILTIWMSQNSVF